MSFLTERQLAELLQLEPNTLRHWRVQGRGPKFVKLGGSTVRYRQSDVDAWLENNSIVKHALQRTADAPSPRAKRVPKRKIAKRPQRGSR